MHKRKLMEQDIQAFIDNELDQNARRRVHHLIQRDQAALAYFQKLSRQKEQIQSWWRSLHKH